MKPKRTELSAFEELINKLLRVPHRELKSKLEEEKMKKKRKPKTSASHVSNEGD